MSALERCFEIARERRRPVVFPESDEPRIAAAMKRLRSERLAEPIPLVSASERHVEVLVGARGMRESLAKRMVSKPLFRAAAMVACGEADAMIAGAIAPTRRVIEAAAMAIGMADDVKTPSSCFLMAFPDGRELVYSDCAVNVDPDASQLADIAQASEATGRALLQEARVGFLSFSTGTSGVGPSVEKVRVASEATGFPGPLQGDAALNSVVSKLKGLDGQTCNVLVFPDLDAGNIAYKLSQEMAGARAIGPILQGFARPVCDLSRGATSEDIVAATVVTSALIQ